jgi:RNA 3'-phosphate cyclase
MLNIDGSYLEGGGQIVRTALALSALTGQAVQIDKIREARPQPGLKAQHVSALTALGKLCEETISTGELGDSSLAFEPGKLSARTLSVDVGTAGSLTLLLQALTIPCCFAPGKIRLKLTGGTDVLWSPSYDYFDKVILPHYQHFADIKTKIEQRGYYPKGGGKIDLTIKPHLKREEINNSEDLLSAIKERFSPINLTKRGELKEIQGISHAARPLKDRNVAERQATGARHTLSSLGVPVKIKREYSNTLSLGSGITLWAVFCDPDGCPVVIGSDALGEREKKAEAVGKEAAEKLISEIESEAPVDTHLADNLVPLLALTGGELLASRISQHTLSNIYVVKEILGVQIDIQGKTLSAV